MISQTVPSFLRKQESIFFYKLLQIPASAGMTIGEFEE